VQDAARTQVYILREDVADERCHRGERDGRGDGEPGHRHLQVAVQACAHDLVDQHLAPQQRMASV
jgi:hypothetical protein